ncbi:Fic family protein [Streptococcus dentiloxodontae]
MYDYKELKKIYYSNRELYEREYTNRINGYSCLKTNLYPRLMKKETFASQNYPLFVTLLLDIQELSQRINDQSREILELAQSLPRIAHDQFYQEQLYKSIISTNEIEGIHTTRKELIEASKYRVGLHKQLPKHLSTLRMYQNILKDDFLHIHKLQDIHDIYEQLTEGEIADNDKLDGTLFRDDGVFIQDEKTGKITHIPPHKEEQIAQMLESWIDFINTKNIPFLIKACLAHYFFENSHPFYDGNGRTGRYILAKYLSRRLDKFSGLVISQKINEQKAQYYKAFQITGNYLNRADGTFFLKTLLTFLADGQEDIIHTLNEKHQLFTDYTSRLEQNEHLSEAEKYVLYLLVQSKLFIDDNQDGIEDRDIIRLAKQSSHSFSKKIITEAIQSLEEKELVLLISKKPLQHMLVENF